MADPPRMSSMAGFIFILRMTLNRAFENDNGDHFDMRDYHVLAGRDGRPGDGSRRGAGCEEYRRAGRQLWDSDCACKGKILSLFFAEG